MVQGPGSLGWPGPQSPGPGTESPDGPDSPVCPGSKSPGVPEDSGSPVVLWSPGEAKRALGPYQGAFGVLVPLRARGCPRNRGSSDGSGTLRTQGPLEQWDRTPLNTLGFQG